MDKKTSSPQPESLKMALMARVFERTAETATSATERAHFRNLAKKAQAKA
ncbi:hypothetical protein [Parasphingorhabdus sp.]